MPIYHNIEMLEQERNQKRIRAIIKFFGVDFFKDIKILDIGAGDGTIARAFADMGANITCLDARKSLLDAIHISNPKIRCIKADLDQEWPFHNEFFDLTLHLGTLNHLMYIEKHLNFVCQNTNYLILDSQVCDSSRSNKYVLVKENKHNQEHSFNGVGCKPSPAFVERIFQGANFQFERLEEDSCNVGKFVYDWIGKDSNSIQLGLSRMWFARRKELRTITATQKEHQGTLPRWRPPPATLSIYGSPLIKHTVQEVKTDFDAVKQDSREFSIVHKRIFTSPNIYTASGVILPTTISSRSWYQKIEPHFPNLRLHNLAHTMIGFHKSKASPDLIMCRIDNLVPGKRVFIEEWDNYSLTTKDINALAECGTIITPSLLNEHMIKKVLPSANVHKMGRFWPNLNINCSDATDFIYFEKDSTMTRRLIDSWNDTWGTLTIVGSTIPLPKSIKYISDMASYETIIGAMKGCKSLIDFSNNNYYISGLIELAKSVGLNIISNNYYGLTNYSSLISFDKINKYPTSLEIEKAIKNSNTSSVYNKPNDLNKSLMMMLGTHA